MGRLPRVRLSWLAAAVLLGATPPSTWADPARPPAQPRIVVSLRQGTLRLELRDGRRRVYPVGTGRLVDGVSRTPTGTFYTGADPTDRDLYLPSRPLPAFHRGLPTLRLNLVRRRPDGQRYFPLALHGPVSPTLVWGSASGGCLRLPPYAIREIYDEAMVLPALPVTILDGPDSLPDGQIAEPDARFPEVAGCPEARTGVRRLMPWGPGPSRHDRVCGGVDHHYALDLRGGDLVSVRLQHSGPLAVWLYGPRVISPVAQSRWGFIYPLPPGRHAQGDRILRIVAPASDRGHRDLPVPYTLSVTVLGAISRTRGP